MEKNPECAPSGQHNPLSPEHENGNDIMCNSHGNNTKCKTGMTQEGNLLTMITDTDYLNRDYKKTLSGERAVCESFLHHSKSLRIS